MNIFNEIIDYYANNIFWFIFKSSDHKFKRASSIDIYIHDTFFVKNKFNNFTEKNDKKEKETNFYTNFIFDNSKDIYEMKKK